MIDTQMCIFFCLIRISYLSTSGVESESQKKKIYEGVVGLYFFFLVSCKADVGRSFVRSFVYSFVPLFQIPFHPFIAIRHLSFVVRSSFIYLTTASLVLVANRRFFLLS